MAIGDCVDIYVQAPGDPDVKQAVYDGAHKKRYAVKFFIMAHPSGRIFCVEGPYRPAGKGEDFVIFDHLLAHRADLREWLQTSDEVLLDRGFERALACDDKRLCPANVRVPLYSHDGQWSTEVANESRKCTSKRWLIEQLNSHMKTFHLIHSVALSNNTFAQAVCNHEVHRLPQK